MMQISNSMIKSQKAMLDQPPRIRDFLQLLCSYKHRLLKYTSVYDFKKLRLQKVVSHNFIFKGPSKIKHVLINSIIIYETNSKCSVSKQSKLIFS